MSVRPYVLLDPRKRPTPELSEPAETVHPLSVDEAPSGARTHHKTIRSILVAVVGSVMRFSDKYAYYSRLGYSRDAARRKARWHIR